MKRLIVLIIFVCTVMIAGCAGISGPTKPSPLTIIDDFIFKDKPFTNLSWARIKNKQRKGSLELFVCNPIHTNISFGYQGEPNDNAFIAMYPAIDTYSKKIADSIYYGEYANIGIDKSTLKKLIMVEGYFFADRIDISGSTISLLDPSIGIHHDNLKGIYFGHSKEWLHQMNDYLLEVENAWKGLIAYLWDRKTTKKPVNYSDVEKLIYKIASLRYIQNSYLDDYNHRIKNAKKAVATFNHPFVLLHKAELECLSPNVAADDHVFSKAKRIIGKSLPDMSVLSGFSKLRHGKPSEAAALFLKAIHTDPNFAPAYYGLTCVEIQNKNKPQAMFHLKKACDLRPQIYMMEMLPAILSGICKGKNIVEVALMLKDYSIEFYGKENKREKFIKYAQTEGCPQPEMVITKDRTVDFFGETKYEMSGLEAMDDAKILAVYSQKSELANEAAGKLITEYGVKGSKEEVAAAIMTSQKFTVADAAIDGSALTIPVVLAVNADEVGRIVTGFSKEYNAATYRWARNLRYHFDKAMGYKRTRVGLNDYKLAVKKARALNQYNQYMSSNEPTKPLHIESAEKNDPTNEVIQARSIESDILYHSMDEAAEHQAKALASNPGLIETYIIMGKGYFDKNEFAKAKTQFKKALEIDPTFPIANYMLASIYMKEGDTANGTKYLRLGAKYNNIDMKPIEGPYNIPDTAFTESGNSIEALVTIQAKVESVIGAGMKAKSDADPDAAPKNIIEEAIAIRKNGNPRDSIKKLEKLMHRYPDDQSIRLQLGWCYFDLKEYNNAKQFFKQSLNYFVSPLMIGWCYDELKEHQKAVDWFTYYNRPTKWCKNVEKKDPSLVAKSFVRASQIFYNYRNYDKGVKWSKKSVTLHPSNHGYWVLGMNHYQMKDYKEAVVAFENALRLDPNNKAYQKDLKRAKRKAKTFGLF